MPRAAHLLCSDPDRSGRRHHRHLAALPLSRRRLDGERRDQPARARRGRVADRPAASSCGRSTPTAPSPPRSWSELDGAGDLALLALLARHYRLENATLTTRGESPAGAGIAGSSALTIAVCGALARWTGGRRGSRASAAGGDERRVPDDSRADRRAGLSSGALRRHRVDRARRRRHPPRRARRRSARARAAHRPRLHRRAAQLRARTTGRSRSATSTAIATSSTASSGSATRRRRCATALERGDWDEVGRQIAIEWDNRKRLAPGVTTPAIDDLIARAIAAGATAAKVCGAGGGGCLFCYGPPAARAGDCRRAGRAAARGCSTTASRPKACGLDNLAIARILREIADLLEIKDDNPFKIRAYRNGADIVANHPHELATLDEAGLREIPGIGKDLAARIREIARDRRHRLPSRARRRVSADHPRPAASAGRRAEDRRDAVSRARHPHARRSRARGARRPDSRAARHGREEGSADPQGARRTEALRRPASAARRARRGGGARRATCASARRTPSSSRSAACGAAATPAATSTARLRRRPRR